jgi:hypothetical protein
MPTITETMPVLISGTPLSLDLIKTGWPYFSFREKAEILQVLLPNHRNERQIIAWRHHHDSVVDLVLADENPLIRRMAAQNVYKPSDYTEPEKRPAEQARYDKVQRDPVDCVRHHWDEKPSNMGPCGDGTSDEYQWFWSEPQYKRLVFVHGTNNGSWIAGAVSYAMDNRIPTGGVTLEEVMDVQIQFFTWRDYVRYVEDRDSFDEYDYITTQRCAALWSLVPSVPAPLKMILLSYLPEEGCTQEILNALSEGSLEHLLFRSDFDASNNPAMRSNYYKEGTEGVRRAALSSKNFTLKNSDFTEFMPLPEDDPDTRARKIKGLHLLEDYYAGGTLAQLGAINFVQSTFHEDWWRVISDDHAPWMGRRFVQRVKQLPNNQLNYEVFELRLLYLAWSVAKMDSPENLPSELGKAWIGKFKKSIEKGNPWKTFLNFRGSVSAFERNWLMNRLPSPDGFEFGCIPADFEGVDTSKTSIDLVAEASQTMEKLPESDKAVLGALTYGMKSLHQEATMANKGVRELNERLDRFFSKIVSIVKWGLVMAVLFFLDRWLKF